MSTELLMFPCCSKLIKGDSNDDYACCNNFGCRESAALQGEQQNISRIQHLQQRNTKERLNPKIERADLAVQQKTSTYENSVVTRNTPSESSTTKFTAPPTQSRTNVFNNHEDASRKHLSRNYDTAYVRNAVAQAVIICLQRWCCHLFWLTICVIGCCSDENDKMKKLTNDQFLSNTLRRRIDVGELEVQLLHTLTGIPVRPSSKKAIRPLRSSQRKRRSYHLSRKPPSYLFTIAEDDESA